MEKTRILIIGDPKSGKSYMAMEIAEAMKNIGLIPEIIDEPGDYSIDKRKKLLSQEGQVLGDGTWSVIIEVGNLEEIKKKAKSSKTSIKKVAARRR
jgi:adenylate kinase family enzyme